MEPIGQKHVQRDDRQRLNPDCAAERLRNVVALDELVEDRRACCEHREARPENPLDVVVDRVGVGEVLNEAME